VFLLDSIKYYIYSGNLDALRFRFSMTSVFDHLAYAQRVLMLPPLLEIYYSIILVTDCLLNFSIYTLTVNLNSI